MALRPIVSAFQKEKTKHLDCANSFTCIPVTCDDKKFLLPAVRIGGVVAKSMWMGKGGNYK